MVTNGDGARVRRLPLDECGRIACRRARHRDAQEQSRAAQQQKLIRFEQITDPPPVLE
jgi:hypothetical protein